MAIREARWDCQYCGTTGILGRHKACPNCGTSRPEGTTFYLPEDAPEVKKQKFVEQAKIGPDWICAYCGSSNAADVAVCGHCGAAREATSSTQQVKEYNPGGAPRSGDMDFSRPVQRAARPESKSQASPRPWQQRKYIIAGLVAAFVLLLCVGPYVVANFFGGAETVTVQSFHWERAIEIEALETVVEEDWDVPAGGRIQSQREAVHHYDEVLAGYEMRTRQVSEQVQVGERTYVCGQRDLGNGFFEDVECTEPIYETQYHTETYEEPIYDQVPVYRTQYTYEIDKWMVDRTERASADHNEPFWPDLNLAAHEREGQRTEAYEITFVNEAGETYRLAFPFERWRTFERGRTYELELSGFGTPVDVRP